MTLNLIWAESINGTIGDSNKLLWKIKKDMDLFKEVTKGHIVVMGRKTHESIGKELPGRRNVIISRNLNYETEIEVTDSIEYIIELAKENTVFCIGGLEIYNELMPYADFIYQTIINKTYKGDTKAPRINSKFSLISTYFDFEDNIKLQFNKYKRL